MQPLALLMLLAFLVVVVLALIAWTLISPQQRRAVEERPRPVSAFAPPEPVRPAVRSNDELRGAKARVTVKEKPRTEDAFERFLRAGRDDQR